MLVGFISHALPCWSGFVNPTLLFVKILNFLTFIILANERSALQMLTSTQERGVGDGVIEPKTVVNTGDVDDVKTVKNLEII